MMDKLLSVVVGYTNNALSTMDHILGSNMSFHYKYSAQNISQIQHSHYVYDRIKHCNK